MCDITLKKPCQKKKTLKKYTTHKFSEYESGLRMDPLLFLLSKILGCGESEEN